MIKKRSMTRIVMTKIEAEKIIMIMISVGIKVIIKITKISMIILKPLYNLRPGPKYPTPEDPGPNCPGPKYSTPEYPGLMYPQPSYPRFQTL
jgi:hypothetical protein